MGRRMRWEKRKFVNWADVPKAGRLLELKPGWEASIYALVDPRDNRIRYVGVTLKDRREAHLKQPTNSRMREWLAALAEEGHRPMIQLISYAPTARWEGAELEWVAWCRARGDLMNVDPGGNYRGHDGKPVGLMKGLAGMTAYQLRVEKQTKRRYYKDPTGGQ